MSLPAFAANHYVWCGASGTASGADFTNAYTDLPASLTRGDIYYIAGSVSCTYGFHTFNDALSGISIISILHATSAANSGVAGWQAGFGTNIATWSTSSAYGGGGQVAIWAFTKSYYTFDGILGTIGTTEPTTGTFGFYLHKAGDKVNLVYLDGSGGAAPLINLTFNHVEFDGSPMDWNNMVGGASAFLSSTSGGQHGTDGLSISNSYMHDNENGAMHFHSPTNLTVNHNWIARSMFNVVTTHANGIGINPFDGGTTSPNLTISNNVWEDVCGTSAITLMTGIISNLAIYGNTFFQTTQQIIFPGKSAPDSCIADGQIGDLGVGDGTSNSGGALITSGVVYNNTFYNGTSTGGNGILFANTNDTNVIESNNLFVNNENTFVTVGCTGCSEDHNTILNSKLGFTFPCSGTGDSCQTTTKTISSASVTSNVADVVTSTAHGLSAGNAVLVLGSEISGGTGTVCGIDTFYPYPTVSNVVSSTEFQYTVQTVVPDATCKTGGFGRVYPSPVTLPFSSPAVGPYTLTSETVTTNLNNGTTLAPPYNTDPAGATRGADGTWERGAFEFNSGNSPATAPALGMFASREVRWPHNR